MSCPRCTNSMDELLRIAPTATDQGLIAYECSSCGYVTSVLVAPDGRRSRLGGQRTPGLLETAAGVDGTPRLRRCRVPMPARECPWTKNGVREIVTGTLPAERPRHSELLHEIKYDGLRLLALRDLNLHGA